MLSSLTPHWLFFLTTVTVKYLCCLRFCEFQSKPITRRGFRFKISLQISIGLLKLFVSRRSILIYCSLVLFPIYLYHLCEYFLACSKVSGEYIFRYPMTTDRPFTREKKSQSSVAKPSIFFTESTIQTYQSTDGSHGKLA